MAGHREEAEKDPPPFQDVGGGYEGYTVAGLTVIDTSVFVIDLRYKKDKDFAANRAFLDWMAQERSGATTIFNLLEVCGILSFNLNEKQLGELFFYFPQHYGVDVLPSAAPESLLPAFRTGDLLNIVLRKAGVGDALIIAAIEKHIAAAVHFVSWNAQHFVNRLTIPCLTPREFLKDHP